MGQRQRAGGEARNNLTLLGDRKHGVKRGPGDMCHQKGLAVSPCKLGDSNDCPSNSGRSYLRSTKCSEVYRSSSCIRTCPIRLHSGINSAPGPAADKRPAGAVPRCRDLDDSAETPSPQRPMTLRHPLNREQRPDLEPTALPSVHDGADETQAGEKLQRSRPAVGSLPKQLRNYLDARSAISRGD